MKTLFPMLISLLALLCSCEKDEEILPVPPPSTEIEAPAKQQDVAEEAKQSIDLESETFQYGKFKSMPYRILAPRNYDSTKMYPVHIFLHGIKERGSDNEKQLSFGASYFQADDVRDEYPSFIVFPQCPSSDYWFDNTVTETLKGLIDALVETYQMDQEKISIGGFSMGAYGTFAMVADYPELFDAAVAIAGDGDEDKASVMAKTKWRIFAGKKDDVVSPAKSEKMARALEKAGASVGFTLYPDANHGATCMNALKEPGLFAWLFSDDNTDMSQADTN